MTEAEKAVKVAEAEAEKKRRYDEAVDVFLRKQKELGGRMPEERDFKKDSMVNLRQLIKDLGKEGYAAAVIEVLRVRRERNGEEREIVGPSSQQMQRLKLVDPEKYAQQIARRERRRARERKNATRIIEEREQGRAKPAENSLEQEAMVMTKEEMATEVVQEEKVVQENVGVSVEIAQEEKAVQENAKTSAEPTERKKGSRRGKQYTYAEIWEYAKKFDLAHLSDGEIRRMRNQIGGPSSATISRALGLKQYWAAQLNCETAEEAQSLLAEFLARDEKLGESPQGPSHRSSYEPEDALIKPIKIVTLEDINELLKPGGAIDRMYQISDDFIANLRGIVYVGDIPVEIRIKAEKI
ncbi:hypothetical protein IJ103_01775 [Candidatus Saccharibacteria bacterium]|nr:hypothetical protein [Candidatus Saccharibacteria bacterium]